MYPERCLEIYMFATDQFFSSIPKELRLKLRFNELASLIQEIFYNYYHMIYFSKIT